MRYLELKIDNFLCYKNKQTLTFPEENQLFIIHGKNGSGKSSLLHAFRFCMYGRTKIQGSDEYKPIASLINDANKTKGNWSSTIELKFSDEDINYKIKRKIKNRINKPTSDSDFVIDLEFFQNSKKQTGVTAQESINNILSEEVSKFFLLDMEEVKQLEESLGKESSSNKTKQNIEKAIAISFLKDSTELLEEISDKSFEKMQKNKKLSKKEKQLMDKLEREQSQKLKYSKELAKLEEQLLKTEEKKIEAEKFYLSTVPKQEIVEKRKELVNKKNSLNDSIDLLEKEIKEYFKTSWFFPAEKIINSSFINLNEKLENARDRDAEKQSLKKDIIEKEKEIKDSVCTRCHQHIDDDRVKLLKKELEVSKKKLDGFEKKPTPSVAEIKPTEQAFQNYLEQGNRKIILEKFSQYYDAVGELDAISNQLSSVNEQLEDVKGVDTENAKKQYEKFASMVNSISVDIEDLKSAIIDSDDEIDEIKKEINENQLEGDENFDKEAIIAGGISTILKKSSDLLIEKTVKNVADFAKEVFISLINDPEYYELVIDDGYFTQMRKKGGATIGDKSYGQARIAAISLLSSLSRQSISKAPAVLDTPMAGLDKTHTKNLYDYFQYLSDQTIIFANDAEFIDEEHRPIVENFLSGEATIEVGDADEAKIHTGRIEKYLKED